MKVNFKLVENYAINLEGRLMDLRDNFDFIGFEYNVEDQTLVLKWNKASGDWVQTDELAGFTLIHQKVNYLSIISRDTEAIVSDDKCLGEITFFPSTEREMNDSIIDQALTHHRDDIIFMF